MIIFLVKYPLNFLNDFYWNLIIYKIISFRNSDFWLTKNTEQLVVGSESTSFVGQDTSDGYIEF